MAGAYETLIRDTLEAVLPADRPMSIRELAGLVAPRLFVFSLDERYPPVDVLLVEIVLRAHPERFAEVAPGVWVRRNDGPEAGVPARPRRPPVAGSAAAEVAIPVRHVSLDAIGGSRARIALAER